MTNENCKGCFGEQSAIGKPCLIEAVCMPESLGRRYYYSDDPVSFSRYLMHGIEDAHREQLKAEELAKQSSPSREIVDGRSISHVSGGFRLNMVAAGHSLFVSVGEQDKPAMSARFEKYFAQRDIASLFGEPKEEKSK